jgi:predicted dehydrogenase
MQDINWGIIGCGNVTELKSGPAFNKVGHSKLVAVMRRDEEKAADYARRHNVPKWYADAGQLINDPEVNAVYVATPPNTHAEYAIAAMNAGKPVYVEKPMARNYAECKEMIRVSEKTGMPLFVAYYRRSLPAFLKVKELIEEGKIGQPLTANIRLHLAYREKDQFPDKQSWHIDPEISGGGHLYDMASHQFDYLDFLFGPITEVHGIAKNLAGLYPAEDTVSAAYTFENGVTGTGSWCFVGSKETEEDVIEISGTEGKLTLSCFQHRDVQWTATNESKSFSFQNPENISQYLIAQVVGELRGQDRCVSTGISGSRTNWVLEEITKEYYQTTKYRK